MSLGLRPRPREPSQSVSTPHFWTPLPQCDVTSSISLRNSLNARAVTGFSRKKTGTGCVGEAGRTSRSLTISPQTSKMTSGFPGETGNTATQKMQLAPESCATAISFPSDRCVLSLIRVVVLTSSLRGMWKMHTLWAKSNGFLIRLL